MDEDCFLQCKKRINQNSHLTGAAESLPLGPILLPLTPFLARSFRLTPGPSVLLITRYSMLATFSKREDELNFAPFFILQERCFEGRDRSLYHNHQMTLCRVHFS